MAGMLSNPRTRTMLFFVGAVGIVVTVFVLLFTGDEVAERTESRTASIPGNIDVTPGGELTERYRELQVTENVEQAAEAETTGRSAIPSIRYHAHPLDLFGGWFFSSLTRYGCSTPYFLVAVSAV